MATRIEERECKICGRCMHKRQFGMHLKTHDITSEEYYLKYLTEENDSICICGNKKTFLGPFVGYTKFCSLKCSNNSTQTKQLKNNTWLKNYGEVNPFRFGSNKHIECIEQLYGVKNVFQSDEIKQKIKETNLEKYGVENPAYLEKTRQNSHTIEANRKRVETRRKNGTFNTSKQEDRFYQYLTSVFNTDDIKREYVDERYPFHCDFYIKSLDLFVELNIHWTHGGRWFDENNPDDVKKLEIWEGKSISSDFYRKAVEVWTIRDIEKRNYAIKNDLRYIVLWSKEEIERFNVNDYGKE